MTEDKLPPLPRMIVAGPFRVPVSLITPQTLARYSQTNVGDCAGLWCPEKSRVYIDKTISLKRQWEVYWHEFQHAVHDLHTIFFGGL